MISRRQLMGSAAALATGIAAAETATPMPKNIVISSFNGLQACARAMEMLKSGADTLDAVIAGVNIVEEDPNDHSVGYAGLPNEEGVVELDASVMHGPTRRCGSVASIRNVKTPSKVARVGDAGNRPHHARRRRRHAFRPRNGLPAGGPAHRRLAPRLAGVEEIAARSAGPQQLEQRSGSGQAVGVAARSVPRCRR